MSRIPQWRDDLKDLNKLRALYEYTFSYYKESDDKKTIGPPSFHLEFLGIVILFSSSWVEQTMRLQWPSSGCSCRHARTFNR